ncbi:MAG TPA: hypothetical protein VNF68_03325 [Candidatus Baltobacteraceae bacterium]|nr:hypothetical protein [Candidatus Baltobacteraceae bacterium]
MKLPYRVGDSFELPLGTGESIAATIVACNHHVVEIAVADLALRAYDEALVLHRWQTCHPGPSSFDFAPLGRYAQDDRVVGAAHAERIVAAHLGKVAFEDAALAVYEISDGVTSAWLEELPHGALLSWTRPLTPEALERVRAHAASRAGVQLQLRGAAAAQAAAFADVRLGALTLAGSCATAMRFERITELTIDAPFEQSALAEAFPNVRFLRVAAGAKRIDFHAIAKASNLERLDCSHVSAEIGATLEPLATLPSLRALRLARVEGLHTLRGIEGLPLLDTLCVEHQHLDTLAPLPACTSLEQLELLGMWQYTIGELAWIHALPRLFRTEIDIGGRRKNLELYRRGRFAYPWPAFS